MMKRPARCRTEQILQVTASGQRNLQEHLASKRHVRRVAAQAAAAAQAAEGPEAAQALALASGAGVAGAAAGGSGGAGAAGGGPGRTYTGVGADVEPYVNQARKPLCPQPVCPTLQHHRARHLPILCRLCTPTSAQTSPAGAPPHICV